ncbi:MAG: indole-3-glycerol phosphate synthase TrpC [Candidatus Omnitrophota bacterium]|jgi:indole-3-glycerol phosphate synthase
MKTDALKEIVKRKKERLAETILKLPVEEVKARMKDVPAALPFRQAIAKPREICLIAEVKKASPSAGVIREDFSPADIAAAYEQAGTQALSVLTEEDFFSGSPGYLREVKERVRIPVMRKDFILEAYQVYESRMLGADAVLLIADLLSKDKLSELHGIASGLGMDCLVESHNEKELKKAVSLKFPLLGLNNRDLHSLEVDMRTTEKLFPLVPKDRTVVVESGIRSRSDVLFLKVLGVSAVLIGSVFMESADIQAKVPEVMGW